MEETPKKQNTGKSVKKTNKKKVELKENQFNMGNGFLLEIVKHPKGDMNGNLEGFLSYQGSEIEIPNKRFYGDNVECMKDFEKRIIPEFANGINIKVFKYLDNEHMYNFTKEYLLKNKDKITYGKVIDVIHILQEDGYEIPKWNDKAQVNNLIDFYKCVDRLSAEFKLHLKEFGFPADRNVNNRSDHGDFIKHDKCRNIVFTRYPWTNGYKAISTINDFVTITDNDLSIGIDIDTFKRKEPTGYKHLKNVLKLFNKVNLKTKETLDNINYDEITKDFKKYIKDNKKELLKVWSIRRPKNYGVYPEV